MNDIEQKRHERKWQIIDRRRRKAKLLWKDIEQVAGITKRTRLNWQTLPAMQPHLNQWQAFMNALDKLERERAR